MHPDILIIGGGLIGLSLAWELAQRGKRVQVIDRGALAREASWAGAGILPPASRAASSVVTVRDVGWGVPPGVDHAGDRRGGPSQSTALSSLRGDHR